MRNRREFLFELVSTLSLTVCNKSVMATDFSMKRAVDSHAHVFLHRLPIASNSRYVPSYDATVTDYLSQLDRHGMTNGVLIQPSFLGTDNSFMLAALKQYPERLRGVVVIDPVRDLAKLEEWNTSCCVGIRLNLIGLPDPDLSSPEWTAVLTKLRALNWQVEIQVESARLQKLVEPILKRKVTVVVDHFGRPDPNLGVDDPGFRYLLTLGPTGNVWVKLSGAYRNGANGRGEQIALQAMPMLRKSFGLKRLIWGSDWPHTQFEETLSYDKVFAFFETLLPDPNDRKVVLWDSPSHLFRFVPSYAAHH